MMRVFCVYLDSRFFTHPGGQAAPEVEGHRTRMPEAGGGWHFAIIILVEVGGQFDVHTLCFSNAQKKGVCCAMPSPAPHYPRLLAGPRGGPPEPTLAPPQNI